MTNDPPNEPIIKGPTLGKVGIYYNYTFVSKDPDETEVKYYIDWGDGQNEEWIGWYASGEEISITHKWSWKGTYIIRAEAIDGYGFLSNCSYFEVTMPRNRLLTSPLLMRVLERFPNVFSILRQLLELK